MREINRWESRVYVGSLEHEVECCHKAIDEGATKYNRLHKEWNERGSEILRLRRERDNWRKAYCKAEQETARFEAWSTELWHKLYAIECGDCGLNMVACKCDD